MLADSSRRGVSWVLILVFAVALTGSVLVVPVDAADDPTVHDATVPGDDPHAVEIVFTDRVTTDESEILGEAFEIDDTATGNDVHVRESVDVDNDTITLTLTDHVLPEDELAGALSFNPEATSATLHADGDPEREVAAFAEQDIVNELDGPAIVEARIPQDDPETLELTFDEDVTVDGDEGDMAEAFTLDEAATENDAAIDTGVEPTVDGRRVTLDLTAGVRPEDGNLTDALEFTNAVANDTLVSDDEDGVPAEAAADLTVTNAVTGPVIERAVIPADDPEALRVEFDTAVAREGTDVDLVEAFTLDETATANDVVVASDERVDIGGRHVTLTLTARVLPEDGNLTEALEFTNADADDTLVSDDVETFPAEDATNRTAVNDLEGPTVERAEIPADDPEALRVEFDTAVTIDGDEGDLADAFTLDESATANEVAVDPDDPDVGGRTVTLDLTAMVLPEDGNLTDALEFTNAVADDTLVSDDADDIPAEGVRNRTVVNDLAGPRIEHAEIPDDGFRDLRIEFNDSVEIDGSDEDLAEAFTLDDAATARGVDVDTAEEPAINGREVNLKLTDRVLPEDGNLTGALEFTNAVANDTLVSEDGIPAERDANRTVVNDRESPTVDDIRVPDGEPRRINVTFDEEIGVFTSDGDLDPDDAFTLNETAFSASPVVTDLRRDNRTVSLELSDDVFPEAELENALSFTNRDATNSTLESTATRIPAEGFDERSIDNELEGPSVDDASVPDGDPERIHVRFDAELAIDGEADDLGAAFELAETASRTEAEIGRENATITGTDTVALSLSDRIVPEDDLADALRFNNTASSDTLTENATGVPAERFSNVSVDNELDGPVVDSAVVPDGEPTSITVEFDRELDLDGEEEDLAAAFSLDDAATANDVAIDDAEPATVNGSRVTVHVTEPILPGDELDEALDFDNAATGGTLVDDATGVPAERFSNVSVENELDGPEFERATVPEGEPERLVVEFDADLEIDGTADDLGAAFELAAADTTADIVTENATLNDSASVALNLTAEIDPGDELADSLSFDPGNASDLLRAPTDGTPAEEFDGETVTNDLVEPATGGGGTGGTGGGGTGGTGVGAGLGAPTSEPSTPSTTTSEAEIRDRVALPDGATPERLQQVDTRTDADGSVADFEETGFVREIRFTESIDRTVQVVELAAPSAETGEPPGTPVASGWVNVSTGPENTSATVVVQLDEDRVSERDLEPEQLRVLQFDENAQRWQPRDTRLLERNETLVLEADTPGFSTFAVSGVRDPIPAIDVSPDPATADEAFSVDGTRSIGRAGDVVAYEWVIGDERFTGDTVTTAIEEPGTYPITLTVRNEGGETNATTVELVVEEPAPDPGVDSAPPPAEPVQLDLFVTSPVVMTATSGLILTLAVIFAGKWLRARIAEYETIRVVLTDSTIRIQTGDDDRMERL